MHTRNAAPRPVSIPHRTRYALITLAGGALIGLNLAALIAALAG
jgi:hypothetical protein